VSGMIKLGVRPEVRFEALAAIAKERGWPVLEDVPRTHHRGTTTVWRTGSEGSMVGWTEETTTGVRAVLFVNAPELAAELAERIPHYERDELLARAKQDDLPGALDALRWLAILEQGEFSPEVVEQYARWAMHEKRAVRRAIIHLGWVASPNILSIVEARCREDSELADKWESLREALANR
jgi:hypothetical protein